MSGSVAYYNGGNVGIGQSSASSILSVGGAGVAGAGVYGSNGIYGLYGSGSTAVYGSGTSVGVEGITTGSYGVYGSGGTFAVYGSGASAAGVYGSGAGYGVEGVGGTYGLWGSGTSYGVWAYIPSTGNVALYASGGPIGVFGSGSTYDFQGGGGEHAQSGTWSNSSDRNVKENFTQLDSQTILDKIIELPVTEWNYKSDKNALHIGPMAQDFYSIFGLNGDDNLSISTIDPAGIALVGVKALNENIDKETSVQQGEIDVIKEQVKKLID